MNNEGERKLCSQAERIYCYSGTCLGATNKTVVTVGNLKQLDKWLCGINIYIYICHYKSSSCTDQRDMSMKERISFF